MRPLKKDVESGLCPDKFAGKPCHPAIGRTLHLSSVGFSEVSIYEVGKAATSVTSLVIND
jgi:hypothetical protein